MNSMPGHPAAPAVLAYIASGDTIPDIVGFCFLLFISALFWFRSYTGLAARGHAFLALVGSVIASGYCAYTEVRRGGAVPHEEKTEAFLSAFAAGAIYLFLAALVLRLWGRWVGGKSTPEERLPGLPGIHAWFCFSNVTVGVLIAVCAWFGQGVSPLVSAIGIGALLAAAPLLRMEAPAAPALVPEDMSAEREKIVSMIESGRLTAEEGAELLQALGASRQQPAARPVMLTGGQRLVLVGAAMVTLGFFLPWFILDSGAEAGRMVNQMQKSLGSAFAGSGIQMPGGMGMPEPVLNAWRVSVNGGGVAHGLGVAVLALALAAALLPYFALALDAATARAIRLLCLGAGGVILLYLLSQNVRAAGIGLMVVMAGYAVQAAALLRDRHPVVTGAGRPVAEHGL